MEPDTAWTGGEAAAGERRLSAPGAGEMDGCIRTPQARRADAIADRAARAAHRHQTLSLYGGEFLACPTRALGPRPEGASGPAGRGARSGCAVGDRARDSGVSGYREPEPVARKTEPRA